jgi:hypothetical protein
MPALCRRADKRSLTNQTFAEKFPKKHNREFLRKNREFIFENREILSSTLGKVESIFIAGRGIAPFAAHVALFGSDQEVH